jgi:hypothetical protein
LPDLIRQSSIFAKKMDPRVKPAGDAEGVEPIQPAAIAG